MPEDLEVSVSFDTDQAVEDLESDIEDSGIGAGLDLGGGDNDGGRRRRGTLGGAAAGAEIGSDIASGPGKGGIAGALSGMLGSLSSLVLIAGAILALVALLEPVQKFLGAILRQFELLIVPVLLALRPVLRLIQKGVVALLQIFRNPEEKLFAPLRNILKDLVNGFISAVNNIPGVNISPIGTPGSVQGVSNPNQVQNILTGNAEAPSPEETGQIFDPFGIYEDTAYAEKSDEAKKETAAQETESVLGDYY